MARSISAPLSLYRGAPHRHGPALYKRQPRPPGQPEIPVAARRCRTRQRKGPRDKARAALITHFRNLWEGDRSATGLPVLLRSTVSNQDAADKIREVFEEQVAPTIAGLTRTYHADIRAGLIVSQLFGLALCRYIHKLPPVVDMTADEIIIRIGPIIQRHLGSSA